MLLPGKEWGAIINLDHMTRPGFKDVLNVGVMAARARSGFIRSWRKELKNYKSKDFYYNALSLPYKVYEAHPHMLKIDKTLQVKLM